MLKRYALITDGVVTNIVEQDSIPPSDFHSVETDTAQIGDSFDGTDFIKPVVIPVEMPKVPYTILRAQRFTAEADPLFFQEQRGEVPAGTWLAKVDEIKLAIPKELV